ncbi:hypothetical protein FI667_g3454, partial [Globisporangium splendens]
MRRRKSRAATSSSHARLERQSEPATVSVATASSLAAAVPASDVGARRRTNNGAVSSSARQEDQDGNTRSHRAGHENRSQQQQQRHSTGRESPQSHQYYPSGQFHIMSPSPLALTPSLSPLYKVPAPTYYGAAGTSSVAPASGTMVSSAAFNRQSMEETIGRIFTTYLPNFFDALSRFQYQQALASLECEGKTDWKSWDAFSIMHKLAASCESTYHLMKYLEPEVLHSDAIDLMYSKLVVLMNHLAEEIKPLIARQQHQFSVHSMTGSDNHQSNNSLGDDFVYGDLGYYAELLDQAAEFFSLRLPMIEVYRSLALATKPLDCNHLLKLLDGLLVRFDAFDHPLLETMRQSAMEENRTLYAAMHTELRIMQYDFTKSMIALHRLKKTLGSWSDHIDSLSEYPLFDETGLGGDDDGLDGCDDEDENYNTLSNSMYSNASYSNQSSAAFPIPGSINGGGESSSVLTRSSICRRSYANLGGNDSYIEKSEEPLVRNPSIMSVESTTSAISEAHSTFSRLLSHSNLLKRGISASGVAIPFVSKGEVANIHQKPGDPYVSSGSSVLTNTLEQAILGGGVTPGAGAASQFSAANGGGNLNSSAAEMIASSMKRQERDDGFALPVFQWAKRFYRSLVAKFTLYFHQWLGPFERQGDFLSHDLTRFIRTPMGISYLQLMDVLLSRGSYRGDDNGAYIMLILETNELEDKGAHYYQNGYLCPSTSRARPSQPEPEDRDHSPQQKLQASGDAPLSRKQQQQLQSFTSSSSTASSAMPLQARHSLFMQVDMEREEEQSDFSPLWGLRGWPAVFCYPNNEPPLQHWPNIVSLIMDNRDAIKTTRPVCVPSFSDDVTMLRVCAHDDVVVVCCSFTHTEKRLKVSYYITRVDPCMHLVLLLEGTRRPNEKTIQDFMQTLTENLQHSGAFEHPRNMSKAPSSN